MNARNAMHEIINFFFEEIYLALLFFNAFRLRVFCAGEHTGQNYPRKDVA